MSGKSRETQSTTTNQEQRVEASPEEKEFNRLALEQRKEIQPLETRTIKSGLDLSDLLLKGMQLPGYLSTLPAGISEDITGELVNRSLRDVRALGQQGGILDSGTLAQIGARTAGDIRLGSAQFNLQNLQQLLNLAVGGQAVPLQPFISEGAQLGQRLAGLRTTTQAGTGAFTTVQNNPFARSFYQGLGSSLGQTLGSPSFKSGGFSF